MKLQLGHLMVVPIALFVISAGVLFWNYVQTGDFIIKDVDLKGGTLVTINSPEQIDARDLENRIAERFGSGIVSGLRTTTGYGATIQIESGTPASEVVGLAKEAGIEVTDYTEETIGPALGNLFFEQVRNTLIIAFVLMSIVIFVIYRNLVSSFGIVFATLANIITTLAITSLLGIQISFAGFAGLLMLIAFTVDTNIVLTSKVVAKGSAEGFMPRYRKALVTGVTLVATIAATMAVVLVLSSSKLLVNIAEVLVIGFLADLVYTWILNARLLEIHFNRRAAKMGGAV
jgi:preprotein translocase subunit SecF